LQLHRGQVGGRRVIGENQFEPQLWSPQIAVGNRQYGLGWFLRTWNGKRLVEHGGNIDGFSAQAAFLPDDGVGFVLLCNVSASGLQAGSIDVVFDAVIGDPASKAPVAAEDPADLERFTGEYRFDAMDADLTVLLRDGQLGLDVPGQMVYDLLPPDADGRRAFRGFEAITVRFNENDDGVIVSLTLDQAGVVFELPRAGVDIPEEITAADAWPYLGRYRSAAMQMEIEVLRQNGRLAVDVPGQMVYELHAPDDEGRWAFRMTDAISVRFERDENDDVTAVTMNQSGLDMRFDRSAPPPPRDEETTTPTAAELMHVVHEQRGRDAYEQLLNLRLDGTIEFRNQGIMGTVTTLVSGFDRFWQRIDLGVFGWIQTSCIGEEGWRQSAFEPLDELDGPMLTQLRLGHPALVLDHWATRFESMTVTGLTEDGVPMMLLEAEPAGLPAVKMVIDTSDGRVVRAEGGTRVAGGGTIPTSVRYEDYRTIAGVLLPFRSITKTPVYGEVVVQIERARPNVELTREPWFMNLPEGAPGPLD
ncbi:MAG: serine hydrolase, partial [Phycisphaerae bacterium]|nr:serine hydrolase [Phycisphaerae bacterium]